MSSRPAKICFGMSSKGRIANLTRAYEPIGNRWYRLTFRGSPCGFSFRRVNSRNPCSADRLVESVSVWTVTKSWCPGR